MECYGDLAGAPQRNYDDFEGLDLVTVCICSATFLHGNPDRYI